MQLKESIELALSAIKSNKLRSLLTMLGIIIGISSVITISAIGSSAQGVIEDELKKTDLELVDLNPNWQKFPDYIPEEVLFTREEAEALKDRFNDILTYYSPYGTVTGKIVSGSLSADCYLDGVNANYDKCTGTIKIVDGRFISERDVDRSAAVVVIPEEAAKYFFGNNKAIGKEIKINIEGELVEFKVVGVYSVKESKLETMLGGGSRYELYTPYSKICGRDFTSMYLVCFLNTEDVETDAKKMAEYINRIKRLDDESIMATTASGQMESINSVLDILSLAIAAIAAISLLVGGIGIMNIMLVSVTERTREIGIRKALGARTRDILRQFLIEAVILSCIGGIIGILQGIGVAAIVAGILEARLVISPSSVIISVTFSIIVGIVFGLFPAKKAANMDPIEALRYE